MKKILIVAHSMNIGGIEKSLVGLLNSFNYDKYSVDLFLMRKEGELLQHIPHQVNVLSEIEACRCYAIPMIDVIKSRNIRMALGRLISKLFAKMYRCIHQEKSKVSSIVELEYSHKYTMSFIPHLPQEYIYDLAISFATPHYFVSNKVKAKKKAAWIHTDYSRIQVDVKSELKMWNSFDYVVGVSQSCVDSFLTVFPSLNSKAVVMENIIVPKMIRDLSEQPTKNSAFVYNNEYINVLSVGRFDKAKNFEAIPEIVIKLRESGFNIKWYIIGFGGLEEKIKANIMRFNCSEFVIVLGQQINPYSYMKRCDIYCQLSLYEGKCVAVKEAQILGKPVIITDYSTSRSQIHDGFDGFIIRQGIDNIVLDLCRILSNPKDLEMVANNCKCTSFDNCDEIHKLYKMIEE